MRRPSVQPQPPLQGAHPSPVLLQSPLKADQDRWPKSTRKQWGTRWVREPPLRHSLPSGSAEASGLPWSASQVGDGEERLEGSLWECVTLSTPAPLHPALDPWLYLSLSQNNFQYFVIPPVHMLPSRPLLPLFCALVDFSLDCTERSLPQEGTVPSPFFDISGSVGTGKHYTHS